MNNISNRTIAAFFLFRTIILIIASIFLFSILIRRFDWVVSSLPLGFIYILILPGLFIGIHYTFLSKYNRKNFGIAIILVTFTLILMSLMKWVEFLRSSLFPLPFLIGAIMFMLKSLKQEIDNIKSANRPLQK